MKKVFLIFSCLLSVLTGSLFIFTSLDKKISVAFQNFIPEKASDIRFSHILADDSAFEKLNTTYISDSLVQKTKFLAYELGAKLVICDFGKKTPAVPVDERVEKYASRSQKERKMPLLNAKIVFPTKNNSYIDSKSPEIEHGFIPDEKSDYSVQLVGQKNGKYYAQSAFAQLLEFFPDTQLKISSSEIVLTKDAHKIPRIYDGSVLLRNSSAAYEKCARISFLELYELLAGEENFYRYLKLLETRGFFGELNSESPLSLYEASLTEKNQSGHKNLKNQFYVLMASALSGNYERILTETAKNDEEERVIKNSFVTARKLFSEIETQRTHLSEKLRESFCIFSLSEEVPVSFSLSNMILKDDFVDALPGFFSVLIAIFFCLILALVSLKFKKERSLLIFSIFYLILTSCALIFAFVLLKIFIGFIIPFSSLIILILILNFSLLNQNISEKSQISALFSQVVPENLLKNVYKAPKKFNLNGDKNESSLLSLSLQNIPLLKNLLSESQFLSFFNHYFEKISEEVTKNGGIIESFTTDEITALFGSPVEDKEHCFSALKAAFSVRDAEKFINKEINSYPLLPKPDGMDDELYTAFFILNHNSKKIFSTLSVLTCEIKAGCLGSPSKKSYRILDDSCKTAAFMKNTAKKIGSAGILLNETAASHLSDSLILRSLGNFENNGEILKIFEILGNKSDDDEKIFNYATYWNQAMALLEKGEGQKSRAIFEKLSIGRPNDKVARYFLNL
ncbi:MAG: hypothetical protein IJ630_09055 [Treponema sp.]|nr:hypothetical protein [Treponema sp.]